MVSKQFSHSSIFEPYGIFFWNSFVGDAEIEGHGSRINDGDELFERRTRGTLE